MRPGQTDNTDPICPLCKGTGWMRVVLPETRLEPGYAGARGVSRCTCVAQSIIPRLLKAACIPAKYKEADLDSYVIRDGLTVPSQKIALEKSRMFVNQFPSTPGLLFMGPQGIGKTHLAIAIIKELLKKGVPCLFRTFPELLKDIQASYDPTVQMSEYSLLSPILYTQVLVLDELGAMNPSEWVRDMLRYVINFRYSENKQTIFTTNYLDEVPPVKNRDGSKGQASYTLSERIGEQMRSRLHEMCLLVKMGGDDFRARVVTARPYLPHDDAAERERADFQNRESRRPPGRV